MASMMLGAAHASQNEFKPARRYFEEARDGFRRASEKMPQTPQFRLGHVTTCMLLGRLDQEEKNLPAALANYKEAHETARKLSEEYPAVVLFKATRAQVCLQRARLLDAKDVVKLLDGEMAVFAELVKSDSENADYRLLHKQARLGRAFGLAELKRFRAALLDMEEAIKLETTAAARLDLRIARLALLLEAGDHRAFGQSVDAVLRDKKLPSSRFFTLAQELSAAAGLAARDDARPLPERDKDGEVYCRRALDLLRRAQGAGRIDAQAIKTLKTHRDFAALRHREDFQRWLAGVEGGKKD
jgi:hypothetical protein